jgi:hypothetical protein
VREDRGNGADLSGRLGFPGNRVYMLDKILVHALIGGKYLDCGSPKVSVNLLTRDHWLPPYLIPNTSEAVASDKRISMQSCNP